MPARRMDERMLTQAQKRLAQLEALKTLELVARENFGPL